MKMTEGEITEKNRQKCKHCFRNTLLPYEYEFSCIS